MLLFYVCNCFFFFFSQVVSNVLLITRELSLSILLLHAAFTVLLLASQIVLQCSETIWSLNLIRVCLHMAAF